MFGIDSNRTLNYSQTDVPANASVFCAGFDIDESKQSDQQSGKQPSIEQTSQADGSSQTPSTLAANADSAYVLPFGKNVEIEQTVDRGTDVKGPSRNDLYIVPMPGMQYEDPEFANQDLT